MSRAELLRPFADAPCQERRVIDGFEVVCIKGQLVADRKAVWGETAWEPCECEHCHGSGLDPLYEGLRYWRLDDAASWEDWQSRDIYRVRRVSASNTATMVCDVRTDVGSVLRAAAACGLAVAYMGPVVGGFDGHQVVLQKWHGYFNPTDDKHLGQGDTDEDAAAAAFAAAVQERAS